MAVRKYGSTLKPIVLRGTIPPEVTLAPGDISQVRLLIFREASGGTPVVNAVIPGADYTLEAGILRVWWLDTIATPLAAGEVQCEVWVIATSGRVLKLPDEGRARVQVNPTLAYPSGGFP